MIAPAMTTQTVLVQDYMTPSPHSIGVSLTLADAKNMMRAYRIRHLPVLDGGKLVGLVSDRDIQMVESMGKMSADEVSIEEAMSQAPYTVTPTTPLEVAARHMAKHKLGSAVVLDANKVVGVFTTTDGMRALADMLAVSNVRPGKLEQAMVKADRSELAVYTAKDETPGKRARGPRPSTRR
jgi:acetoin utilization protein AcuB